MKSRYACISSRTFTTTYYGHSRSAADLFHLKTDRKFVLAETDSNRTPLHEAANDATKIRQVVAEHGAESAAAMAKVIDANNCLALDYIEHGNQEALQLISELTLHHAQKNMDAAIAGANNIASTGSFMLDLNLALAKYLITETSKLGIQSSTTPAANHDRDAHEKIASKIKWFRRTVGRFIPLSESLSDSSINTKLLCVHLTAWFAKQFQVGQCHELSYAALSIAKKIDPAVSAEIYEVVGGNHIVLVLDRDRNTDPSNYLTWNESAVIVDVMSGDAFPSKDIPSRLKTYERHHTYSAYTQKLGRYADMQVILPGTMHAYNVITTFNDSVHKLRPRLQVSNSGYNLFAEQTDMTVRTAASAYTSIVTKKN